jgi:hypothetical protein
MSPFTALTPRIAIALLVALTTGVVLSAHAQVAPAPQPAGTQAPAYPQGTAYPQDYVAQQVPAAPRPNPLRELFAGTVAAVLQAAGGSLVTGVTGSIINWFDRKQRQAGLTPQTAYPPQAAYPPQQGAPAYSGSTSAQNYPATPPTYGAQPSYPATPGPTDNPYQTSPYTADPYGTNSSAYTTNPSASDPYGAAQAPNAYGQQPTSYDWSTTQVYDPQTGQVTAAQVGGYALATQAPEATSIVAGGAYDVHAIGPGGSENYVNAATYEFHTGDRFKVYFRPTLPGRLDVYNINPYGRETRIDSVNMAAGQLTTLGPYEFTATKGDEALRFVLSPCATEQLIAATRDIVNVGPNAAAGYGGATPTSGGFSLQGCGAPTTRSVDQIKTRDIQKVGVDGTTSFALDPISQAELASGQLAPREFTVYFHHR